LIKNISPNIIIKNTCIHVYTGYMSKFAMKFCVWIVIKQWHSNIVLHKWFEIFGFHLLQMCRFFKISKFEISFVSFEQNMKKKKPHFKVDDF
jgi:hypothetical protein